MAAPRRNTSIGSSSRSPKSEAAGLIGRPSRSSSPLTTTNLLILIISHATFFLTGNIYGSNQVFQDQSHMFQQQQCPECSAARSCPPATSSSSIRKLILNTTHCPTCPPTEECPSCPSCPPATICAVCPSCPPATTCPVCATITEEGDKVEKVEQPSSGKKDDDDSGILSKYFNRIAIGMAHATKEDFVNHFDVGVPVDSSDHFGNRDVLFLYSKQTALPTKMQSKKVQDSIEFLSAEEATENCDIMHVLYHYRGGNKDLCLALVPQYESFHIHNFMRVPEKGEGAREHPLRLVSRGMQWTGVDDFDTPRFDRETIRAWKHLKIYMDSVHDIVLDLVKIIKRIKIDNTVIVMVCNFGQSQLLMNFVCSARSRGFDLSNILLFATDEETLELAKSMGLEAFYDEKNFGHLPMEAAGEYGDDKFVLMMMAKVLCVHMVSLTGVDFLFQDVDLIWYKHPLNFFHDKTSKHYNYDVYFQDDGARSLRYTPYSANSGFYYVRNNRRTQNFLTQVLHATDLIMKTFSHQQAMIAVLSEHASLYGLKVKVLSKEEGDFPGGFHYHQRGPKSYFRRFLNGEYDPYIFHMSWTLHKDNKLKFLKQMGEWYVEEKCVDKKPNEIVLGADQTFLDNCCSLEALFTCYYRDKPSVKPCYDSPPIDKDAQSFWVKE